MTFRETADATGSIIWTSSAVWAHPPPGRALTSSLAGQTLTGLVPRRGSAVASPDLHRGPARERGPVPHRVSVGIALMLCGFQFLQVELFLVIRLSVTGRLADAPSSGRHAERHSLGERLRPQVLPHHVGPGGCNGILFIDDMTTAWRTLRALIQARADKVAANSILACFAGSLRWDSRSISFLAS